MFMKRFVSIVLSCLVVCALTACGKEEGPSIPAESLSITVPEETGLVLTVQRNLPLKEEATEILADMDWLNATTECIQVDDIPVIMTYQNDGKTNKPIYIVPHSSWGTKEASVEWIPAGVADVNAMFLSFDMSGYGDSPRAECSKEQAVQDAVMDIDKILSYVSGLGIVNTDRIIMEGIEMGADVVLAYLEKGQFTPAIVTLKEPSLPVGEYSQTQVLLNVDYEQRKEAYLQFLLKRMSVENPSVTVTVKEGIYVQPPAAQPMTPADTEPVAEEPAATEVTVPKTTVPVQSGDIFAVDLTVEHNRPVDPDVKSSLGIGVKMESIRVNHLAALIAYREDGQKKPVYVYLHGSGGGKEEAYLSLDFVVKELNGIFVSFDMPYGGESTHPMRTITGAEVICGVVPDIDNLLAYCSTIAEADMNNIYFHGMSGGAASALAYMTKGVFTPSLLIVTVPCFDFRTYGEYGPPYNTYPMEGDPNPALTKQQIDAILDEHNAYTHAERMLDTYVLAGIGLAGPPNAEMDGKQMEEKFKQMGKTDAAFYFYPDVDHNFPEEFYSVANQKMMEMCSGSDIVNPQVHVNITEK